MDGPLGDKELAGGLHTKSCGHRLIVHRETSDQWCPSGAGPGADTVQHPVGDTDSGIEGTLGKFADNTELCGAVDALGGRDGIRRDLFSLDMASLVCLCHFPNLKRVK